MRKNTAAHRVWARMREVQESKSMHVLSLQVISLLAADV